MSYESYLKNTIFHSLFPPFTDAHSLLYLVFTFYLSFFFFNDNWMCVYVPVYSSFVLTDFSSGVVEGGKGEVRKKER